MSTVGGFTFGFSFPSERAGYTVHANIERNDPCPCGNGRKVKKCHLGSNPPDPLTCVDHRVWPLLAALGKNVLEYLAEIVPAFADTTFSSIDVGARSQSIAIAYYACVAYRVGCAILTLLCANEGEEAQGLYRELNDARMSLAYYQWFKEEAIKLVASRASNQLTFHERISEAGLRAYSPLDVARLKIAAREERQTHPEIIDAKGKHWREPSMKDMLDRLHRAWDADPSTQHVGEFIDRTLPPDLRGSAEARAASQHAVGGTIPSQWLHNTFVLSDRYIEWSNPPRLRPLTNAIQESPNRALEKSIDVLLAVVVGVHRQTDSMDAQRLRTFGFAQNWFQQLLAGDAPQ